MAKQQNSWNIQSILKGKTWKLEKLIKLRTDIISLKKKIVEFDYNTKSLNQKSPLREKATEKEKIFIKTHTQKTPPHTYIHIYIYVCICIYISTN
jgi:hypothetical protein